MNDRACITSTSNTSHEEMKHTALKRDEEQVQAIVNHLNETMTDPFDIEAHIVTSSLLLAKTRARLKTISGLI
jgi:hypothetical protein